ncbi:MAG: hypothetical protein AB1710_06515 [Pseudomonadota bacterium]
MNKPGIVLLMLSGLCLAAGVDRTAAADTDCRNCHLGNDPAGKARDYSYIYSAPEKHHAVGVDYRASGPDAAFNPPTARRDNVSFFDTNGNGIPDADEIQLFDAKIECASCHDPAHGVASPPSAAPRHPSYLRMPNDGSRMCMICHIR